MNINKTTKSLKQGELKSDWYLIDATDIVLGRLAAHIATILRGKNKPTYTPHMDCGDNVIVVNADKIALTGTKADKTKFYWHTGYVGSTKERTLGQLREDKPEQLITNAVKRMMGRTTRVALADRRLAKLHVYAGAEHKHAGQNPTTIDFAALNKKNKRA
ncbi:MAG: 50S ribosomal protein L13 [Rickettsiales bacterium]|jgi:large subunit ribosomal protein L13|nr:50S ribosomal protein L13 [Rickettsiales bacterium]